MALSGQVKANAADERPSQLSMPSLFAVVGHVLNDILRQPEF